MRRRLEKWSQGWVTPSSRQQPRQRTTGSRGELVGGGEGSFELIGSEPSTSAAPTPTAATPLVEDGKLFKTCPAQLELEAAVSDSSALQDLQAESKVTVLCLPEVMFTASEECMTPSLKPCLLRLTREALVLEQCNPDVGAAAAPELCLCSVRLDRVTDVSVAACGPQNKVAFKDVAGAASTAKPADVSQPPSQPASPATGKRPPPLDLGETHDDFLGDCSENGVLWEIPPIPFGQLPPSEPGLPSRWRLPAKVPTGRWLAGQPLADFDRSNAQPQQLLSMAIPPLLPSTARLPRPPPESRQLPEDRTFSESELWVNRTLESVPSESAGRAPHALVVWASSSAEVARSSGRACRLRGEGAPTVLLFADEATACRVREEMLRCRADRLGL
eukprot:gb/GFBE01038963.1/.p1 GENE.gb/GFBE01038963.1/~~gb/GFBE01038963.1/.p1  ORF type:complete len:389 (+),score=54.82 gb/GFBE01038963.1/:1-1167(+)